MSRISSRRYRFPLTLNRSDTDKRNATTVAKYELWDGTDANPLTYMRLEPIMENEQKRNQQGVQQDKGGQKQHDKQQQQGGQKQQDKQQQQGGQGQNRDQHGNQHGNQQGNQQGNQKGSQQGNQQQGGT